MVTICIQPVELEDHTLPYPWFIESDGAVVRQDHWQGRPETLLGFAEAESPFVMVVCLADFLADLQLAEGLVPVFENANGSWETWTEFPIDTARIEEAC